MAASHLHSNYSTYQGLFILLNKNKYIDILLLKKKSYKDKLDDYWYIIHVVIQVSFSLKLFTGYKAIRQQLETSSHNNAKAEGYARLIGDGYHIHFEIEGIFYKA